MHEVITRTYEYQRAQPALFVGARSGMETIQQVLDGKLPRPPILATLDLSLVEAQQGRAVYEGSAAEWQYNSLGTVQGGWLSALLDTAFGVAVQTILPPGCGFTTLDLHVRFVRPVTVAVGRVRAEAQVTHSGAKVITAQGRVLGADSKIYATATTSCLLLKVPAMKLTGAEHGLAPVLVETQAPTEDSVLRCPLWMGLGS